MRMDRATPLLKRVCAASWQEIDVEAVGWLEPFEARICLSRVLDELQEAHTLSQLASLITPHATSDADQTETVPSNARADAENDVRTVLASLLGELRSVRTLEGEFARFLDHVEARPAVMPRTFTPPVGQKDVRRNARSSQADIGSASTSSTAVSSAPSVSATSSAAGGTAAVAQQNPATATSARPFERVAASLDQKVFRFEFTTAMVLWLEAQMTRRLFLVENNAAATTLPHNTTAPV
jgi:hypothetical protein